MVKVNLSKQHQFLSHCLSGRSLQIPFGENVSQIYIVLDVREFHFRFTAGLEVRDDRFDHGGKTLDRLDLDRLYCTVELAFLIVKIHLHRHEVFAVDRDVVIAELDCVRLLGDIF